MSKFKKSSLSMFIVFCMVVASMPQALFAADYDNHWAKNAIAKWSEKGLVVGYEDGTFRPSNAITRGELAAIIVRVFDYSEKTNAKEYIDVEDAKWYAGSVAAISSAKLMNDGEDTFRPEDPATREEAAYAIAQAYKVTGTRDEKFVDDANISEWASASVEALYSNGFVSGNPDGTFAPQRTLTRADVVAMLDKITSELINLAGTYTDDVDGNLVVNTRDVVLKDMTIKGNLYLTEGIGDGDVTLDGITVEGETFVNGGGINSIKSKNSKFNKDMKVSAKNPVRIVIEGDAVKIEAFPGTTVTLTGNFSDVILPPGVNVIIKDATVARVFVQPGITEDKNVAKAVVTIEEGSTVKEIQADAPVEIKGTGKIDNLVVNSEGVKTAQQPAKTETKNEDHKPEIGTAEEKPSTGGGGGGSTPSEPSEPTQPEKPLKKEYLFSGKVTHKGKAVPEAEVEIYSDGVHMRGQTNEVGNYSFYVPSKEIYRVNAWIVDEDRNGYFTKSEGTLANADQIINIELEQQYVVNIKITDKNDNVMVNHLQLKEVEEDNSIRGGWNVDPEGYATIFFFDYQLDKARTFNIYTQGIEEPIGKIENVKRSDKLTTEHPTIKLNYGLGDTIDGTVVDENGKALEGIRVDLDVATPEGDYHYEWVSHAMTDAKGHYSFDVPEKNRSYRVAVSHRDGENVFVSQRINALFANVEPLIVTQSYSVNIKVWDQYGFRVEGANVKLTNKNGDRSQGSTSGNGQITFFYKGMLPGDYTVSVAIGDEVKVQNLTIKEAQYNNFVEFEFEDKEKKVLKIELGNPAITVGNAETVANHIKLYTKNQNDSSSMSQIGFANVDKEGNALLFLPKNFEPGEFNLHVGFEKGLKEWEKAIDLSGFAGLSGSLSFDLKEEIQSQRFGAKISVTTGPSIEFTTTASIKFDLKLGNKNNNVSVVKGNAYTDTIDFTIDAPIYQWYILTVDYAVNGMNYDLQKEVYLEKGKIMAYDPSAEEGNQYKDISKTGIIDDSGRGYQLMIRFANILN